jgi:hypothetical protein
LELIEEMKEIRLPTAKELLGAIPQAIGQRTDLRDSWRLKKVQTTHFSKNDMWVSQREEES